jgi:hypothetical protein
MTVAESKNLRKGSRVCWLGNAADSGSITETTWDAVTGTMVKWPPYTTGICATSNLRRQA